MIRQIFREAKVPNPSEKIDKNGLVRWGAEDNLYPQFLMGLYSDNPIHAGIINQKVTFITAGGIETANPAQIQNGSSAYTLDELTEIICRDFEITNGIAIRYNKNLGTGRWDAYPMDIELVRRTESDVFLEISDDWSKTKQDPEKTSWRRIKNIFSMDENDTEVMMYHIVRPKQRKANRKTNDLTSNYYPTPGYSGAITAIMAGIEMDYFTYSEVVNGYKGGAVIALNNGVPESVQDEDKIIKRIKEDATDRDKQGGLTVLFSDGKDRAPEIHQMNGNDLDKRYIESNKEILRKIMIAHQVISPALFGVMSETLFGSKDELEVAYKLFQESYVRARQKTIEEVLNWSWKKLNKEELNLKFKDYILQLDQNVAETNVVSAALNGMSPLVANKVLENLTVNEIRALAKLPAIADGDKLPGAAAVQVAMSEQDPIIDAFSQCGVDRSSVCIVASRPFIEMSDNEAEIKEQFLAGRFEMTVSDDDRNILQMIRNGESYDSVSKAIGKGGVYITKRIALLEKNGYLDGWNVTDKGKRAAAVLADLQVMYSYELRPNAPDLVGPSSRPFCERMMNLDRLYTRQEIDQISAAVDRDVWTYRGGWYHNPETDRNTPSCRHMWKQNIIVK